ncbi:MAG: hypothetical protein J6S51_01225 [Kiritimatiellae bacterium]|nr:hypothetical protein [Kiritimatiellia bacterium]
MSNIKWLKSEIEKWLRDGVVEKSTADIILSRLLFLSGVLLLVLNVFLARKKKRIASNEN